MPKPLTMAGIFRMLEKIGHRPQQGLNAKVKHYESIVPVLKRAN